MGRYNEAIKAYQHEAIKTNPRWQKPGTTKEMHFMTWAAMTRQGRPATRQLSLMPRIPQAWKTTKEMHFMTWAAITRPWSAYDRYIGLDKEFAPAWINKGNVLEKLGKYSDSLEAYDQG